MRAGSVFGLERAVILVYDQAHNIVNEVAILRGLFFGVEALGDDEMEIAVLCMAEDDGVGVAVFREEASEINGRVGEMLNGEHDVFNDDCSSAGANCADRWEHAFANIPKARLLRRIASEHGLAHEIEAGNGGCAREAFSSTALTSAV